MSWDFSTWKYRRAKAKGQLIEYFIANGIVLVVFVLYTIWLIKHAK